MQTDLASRTPNEVTRSGEGPFLVPGSRVSVSSVPFPETTGALGARSSETVAVPFLLSMLWTIAIDLTVLAQEAAVADILDRKRQGVKRQREIRPEDIRTVD